MLITDLLAEAARIRGGCTSVPDISEEGKELVISEKISDEFSAQGICDIKKRWAMRRRNVRQSDRRLK